MNSLTELNAFSATSITIGTDSRPSRVIFDSADTFSDEIINITSTTKTITPLNEVIDIWNYATANVRYRITIFPGTIDPLTGSTISWASIPAGLTLTSSTNVYTITGFQQASDWAAVKTFTWNLPANWATKPQFYLKVAVIWYDSELASDVERDWFVYDDDFFYVAQLTAVSSVSNTGRRVRFVTTNPQAVASLAQYPETTKTFNCVMSSAFSVSSVALINGIPLTATSNLTASITYASRTNPANLSSQFTYYTLNTTYLDAVRANESYTLNTSSAISNGPLITDALQDGTGTYTMTVVPIPTSAVNTMSSTGRKVYSLDEFHLQPNADSSSPNYGFLDLDLNINETRIVLGNPDHNDNSSPITVNGRVRIYNRSGNNWNHAQDIFPPGVGTGFCYNPDSGQVGKSVSISQNGNTIAFSMPWEHGSASPAVSATTFQNGAVYVYKHNGTNFALDAKLYDFTTTTNRSWIGYHQDSICISYDGNHVFALGSNNHSTNILYHWKYTGAGPYSGWELMSKNNLGLGTGTSLVNNSQKISISKDNYLCVNWRTNLGNGYFYLWKVDISTGALTTITNTAQNQLQAEITYDNYIRYYYQTPSNLTLIYQVDTATDTLTLISTQSDTIQLISGNGEYILGTNIMRKISGVYVTQGSFTSTLIPYDRVFASYSGTYLFVDSTEGASQDKIKVYNLGDTGTSWNPATKTLTLTGTRSQVNTDLDTIQMQPSSGYTSNFLLRYTVVTPRSRTDNRDQTVNYT